MLKNITIKTAIVRVVSLFLRLTFDIRKAFINFQCCQTCRIITANHAALMIQWDDCHAEPGEIFLSEIRLNTNPAMRMISIMIIDSFDFMVL